MFIDEIHKYPDWSRELKEIIDTYSDMQVVISGSSILDIFQGMADLSRRMPIYEMQGLSFRVRTEGGWRKKNWVICADFQWNLLTL